MIIDVSLPDENDEDFDTTDIDGESPERIGIALAKLVERIDELEGDHRSHIEALAAVGLTCTVNDPELFIHDREKAVTGHERMLAEFEERAARRS
jgi:hypothetical protein